MKKKSGEKAEKRPRNKDATMGKLLGAVDTVLRREGFRSLGINAVAREAGVDKVLVYRYFDGFDGLMDVFCKENDVWPDTAELAGGDVERLSGKPPLERLLTLSVNYLRAVRSRPLACEFVAWETARDGGVPQRFVERREQVEKAMLDLLLSGSEPGPDVTPLGAVLAAAVNHLAVRSRSSESFMGLDLSTDKDWVRLETAVRSMVNGVFSRWM